MRILVILLILLAGLESLARAATPEQIAGLIERLSSTDYRERQAAFRELDAIGESALPSLKTTTVNGDSETRLRAGELIRRIEQRQTSARILTPTLVELNFDNTAIDEVVKAINKATGLPLTVSGNSIAEVNKRKITYHSGKVSVWEAVGGFLCEAKLTEWDGLTVVPGLPAPVPMVNDGTQQVFFRGNGRRQMIMSSGRMKEMPILDKTLIYDGTPVTLPTCSAGAVRVRALPMGTPIPNAIGGADDYLIPMQVSAESKIDWSMAPVSIKTAQAIDDQGRRLNASITGIVPATTDDPDMIFFNNMIIANQLAIIPGGNAVRNQFVALRIRKGIGIAKSLREVTGTIALPIRVNEELLALEKPMQASGKAVVNDYGEIALHSVEKIQDGQIKLVVALRLSSEVVTSQMSAGNPALFPGNIVRFNGAVAPQMSGERSRDGLTEFFGLSLSDAKGAKYVVANVPTPTVTYNGDGMRIRATVTFRPGNDAAEPVRLSICGSHPASVEVAFALKDVPVQ